MTETESQLQHSKNKWKKVKDKKGLNIDIEKTEKLVISKVQKSINIKIERTTIKQTDNFKYPGVTINQLGQSEPLVPGGHT